MEHPRANAFDIGRAKGCCFLLISFTAERDGTVATAQTPVTKWQSSTRSPPLASNWCRGRMFMLLLREARAALQKWRQAISGGHKPPLLFLEILHDMRRIDGEADRVDTRRHS